MSVVVRPRTGRPGLRGQLGAAFRSTPRAMWACVAVAILSGWIWTVATPWLQLPDEVNHIGYVKHVGEAGEIPRRIPPPPPDPEVRPELFLLLQSIPTSSHGVPTWSPEASDAAHRALGGRVERVEESGAGAASNNPPLYYLHEAAAYRPAGSLNIFNRILLLRLFSALLAGLTAGLVFLFVREIVPGTPWAWTVGGLAAALHPLFGFISGGVNPDGLLWAAAAGLFLALARALRHGLTWRRLIAVAAALSVGLATKAAMLGLVPGAALALAIAAWIHTTGSRRRRLLTAGAIGAAVLALPVLAWTQLTDLVLNAEVNRAAETGGVRAVEGVNIRKEINYIWQLYMPPLPFQNDLFHGFPPWDIWFEGFVGRFGHFWVEFPSWVNKLALVVALGVLGLAARGLWICRAAVRARLPELVAYAGLAVGLMILVGVAGFQYTEREGVPFEQARYLLPLLPLYAALLAVAARGAGRRGRQAGVVIVGGAAMHMVFAVLLTVGHYYG